MNYCARKFNDRLIPKAQDIEFLSQMGDNKGF